MGSARFLRDFLSERRKGGEGERMEDALGLCVFTVTSSLNIMSIFSLEKHSMWLTCSLKESKQSI